MAEAMNCGIHISGEKSGQPGKARDFHQWFPMKPSGTSHGFLL